MQEICLSQMEDGVFGLPSDSTPSGPQDQPETSALTTVPVAVAPTPPSPRPYQQNCLLAIEDAYKKGCRRQLVVVPTGGGKTNIAGWIMSHLGFKSMLFLAHRKELISQAAARLASLNPTCEVEIEQAELKSTGTGTICVASIPTIGRKDSDRIKKLVDRKFDLVIIDEAHHAASKSYITVMRALGCHKDSGPLLVGITATPMRGDGESLANIFDKVVYDISIKDGMRDGWLCPVKAIRVKSGTDISNIHIRAGEFDQKELAQKINVDGRNSKIMSAIKDHASDRKHIVIFCIDIEHANTLAAQLTQHGIPTVAVTEKTHKYDRDKAQKDFREGKVHLTNVSVFLEGWDAPMTDCIVMARPFKSPLAYFQACGRGLRPYPGKDDVLIMDIYDSCGKHYVMSASDLMGMRNVDLLGQDPEYVQKVAQRAEELGVMVRDGDTIEDLEKRVETLEKLELGLVKIETLAEAVSLFEAAGILGGVDAWESMFPWLHTGGDFYRLRGMRGERYTIERNELGEWNCYTDGAKQFSTSCGSGERPNFKKADTHVKRWAGVKDNGGYQTPLWRQLARGANWRRAPVKEKQVNFLKALGVAVLPPDMTRGAASDLIERLLAAKSINAGQMMNAIKATGRI